jgi:predicted regulator of Ras-like GTPase activity (Roadblock/LC7/MglB family)
MVNAMAQAAHTMEPDGFEGAISGMSLADIIQIRGNNRDSGCLIVEHLGRNGMIFLREGEVLHAEQGALSGEEAFYEIMSWAGGRFRTEPKVATTSRSINQPLGFLILEAFRRLDESKVMGKSAPQPAVSSSKEGTGVSAVSVKLKAIREVEQALLMSKDGVLLDDSSHEAEFLGANGLFISLFAGQLGPLLGVGEFKAATVHGNDHHLFLFGSKQHYLFISAKSGGNVNALEGEIRRVLSQK